MNIQYTPPEFEPMTFGTQVSSHNQGSCPTFWGLFVDSGVKKHMHYRWAVPGLFFLYFRLFNTAESKQMFNINFADDWI